MPCCLLEHVDSNHTWTCACWPCPVTANRQTDMDMTHRCCWLLGVLLSLFFSLPFSCSGPFLSEQSPVQQLQL